jgi:predicted ATP-grasp superfamily ATP-dependent carboligase
MAQQTPDQLPLGGDALEPEAPTARFARAAGRPKGMSRRRAPGRPLALVMGDVDLVRALGLAGIGSAFFGYADAPARYSRHVRCALPWIDPEARPLDVLDALLAFARAQADAPVLLPQTDDALLLVSRHRDELSHAFRFALGDAELIEQLVDKERFHALAQTCGFPVPPVRRLQPRPGEPPPVLDLRFPVVIKPVVRRSGWESIADGTKAFHVDGPDDLAAIWPRLAASNSVILAQEVVAGPETSIESFHAYVDERGDLAAGFTGRKIRTLPARYGHSTAVQVTHLPDVAELGREVFACLGLRGVAKADFKRDAAGRLHLLEINPRFTLWHHPAALAGVNIPAMVYADLTGAPRPQAADTPGDVAWCKPLRDVRAAHAAGMAPLEWLRWARSCSAVSGLSREDPMPFLRGALPRSARHHAARLLGAPFRRRAA